ncbi:MAG: LuxR C-terminal-related transcriptional regulator, partial [bacterium]
MHVGRGEFDIAQGADLELAVVRGHAGDRAFAEVHVGSVEPFEAVVEDVRAGELVEIPTRHVVQLRIAPLEGEMPPIAEIRVGTRRSFEIAQGDRTATPSTLGAREVEIARLLQSGLSRPEVAARLGISAQTVST